MLGDVTTIAGGQGSRLSGFLDGLGTNALFNQPIHCAIDSMGVIYITDYYNHVIRKLTTDGMLCWGGSICVHVYVCL